MPFSQAPVGVRQMIGGWRRSGWLWCCGRSCWWCSRRMTKRSSPTGSGRERRGASERRLQSQSTLLTCGPVSSPTASPRVCHRPPDRTRRSPYSSAHPGTLWCWLQADFEDVRWYDVALTWNHTKDHNCSRKLCFQARPCYSWQSKLAFWGCWQWSCCHNLDLACWTLCQFQTW